MCNEMEKWIESIWKDKFEDMKNAIKSSVIPLDAPVEGYFMEIPYYRFKQHNPIVKCDMMGNFNNDWEMQEKEMIFWNDSTFEVNAFNNLIKTYKSYINN